MASRGKGSTSSLSDDPKSKKKVSKGNKRSSGDKCKDCGLEIDKDTKALNCNFCFKWVCIQCLEVSDELYMLLVKNPTSPLMVPCKECGNHVASLQEMRNTLNEVRRHQEESKKELHSINSRMGTLNKEIQKTIKVTVKKEVEEQLDVKMKRVERELEESLDRKWESLRENTALPGQNWRNEVGDIVSETLTEDKLKQKKKTNLIIFNVPESNSIESEEITQHNRTMTLKVLNSILKLGDIETKVKRVIRLGRKRSEETSRPIKVVFDEPDTKYKFLQSAYKIQNSDDEMIKKVQIANDRTPKEIEEYKKLRAELERRTQEGEVNLKIRRGKIVTIKDSRNQVRSSIGSTSTRLGAKSVEEVSRETDKDTDSEKEINFSRESMENGDQAQESMPSSLKCNDFTPKDRSNIYTYRIGHMSSTTAGSSLDDMLGQTNSNFSMSPKGLVSISDELRSRSPTRSLPQCMAEREVGLSQNV